MKKNIADEDNNKVDSSLEKWIGGLSKGSISKVHSVCNVLRSISELSNETIFNAPYEAFENANIDSKSVEKILIELWRKKVIDLREFEGECCVSSWNKEFEPDNSLSDSTMVDLNNELFDHIFQILQSVKNKIDVIPEGRDYIYENGVLLLRLQDGSSCPLDLSGAVKLRSVFESFFFLYKNGVNKLFSRRELLTKHKELTGKEIAWRTFILRKNAINGKMINRKEGLKNRIVWGHDKESDKYRFDILPLSDN